MTDEFERGPDGRSTDVPSGRGVPNWMASSLNFCSRCGGQLMFGSVQGEDRERLACGACRHIAYVNPRLVVTTLPITESGEIILIRRGIEPGVGFWAQPGGFLEVDETVHEAAIRETWEETGLLVVPGDIVGLYTRLEAAVVTIVYESRIVGGTADGTRVTVNPLITCGHCDYCVSGRDNLCAHRTMIGMTRPGGFAEHIAVPERTLIEIPADMPARTAALTEPAATALHALHLAMRALARPLPETRLLVIGGGAVGLLSALLARSYGCRDVTLVETNPLRRDAARAAGELRVLDPADSAVRTENAADLVIDAVGAKATRNAALAAVKPGGVVTHIGWSDLARPSGMHEHLAWLANQPEAASKAA